MMHSEPGAFLSSCSRAASVAAAISEQSRVQCVSARCQAKRSDKQFLLCLAVSGSDFESVCAASLQCSLQMCELGSWLGEEVKAAGAALVRGFSLKY